MTFSSHLHMVSPNVVPILHVLGVFFAFLQLFPQIASLLHFFAHFCHEHLASDNNQGKRSVFKLGQTEEQHCCHTKHYQSTANWNRTWHTSSSSSLDSLPKTSGKSACFQISGTMIVVWICNGKRSSNTMVPQIGLSWGGGGRNIDPRKTRHEGVTETHEGGHLPLGTWGGGPHPCRRGGGHLPPTAVTRSFYKNLGKETLPPKTGTPSKLLSVTVSHSDIFFKKSTPRPPPLWCT